MFAISNYFLVGNRKYFVSWDLATHLVVFLPVRLCRRKLPVLQEVALLVAVDREAIPLREVGVKG